MSNEPLAKAKSWELRFYRKERRKASKKSRCSFPWSRDSAGICLAVPLARCFAFFNAKGASHSSLGHRPRELVMFVNER